MFCAILFAYTHPFSAACNALWRFKMSCQDFNEELASHLGMDPSELTQRKIHVFGADVISAEEDDGENLHLIFVCQMIEIDSFDKTLWVYLPCAYKKDDLIAQRLLYVGGTWRLEFVDRDGTLISRARVRVEIVDLTHRPYHASLDDS